MNGLLSVLLLVSICSIQAGRTDHGNGPCEQMRGRCVPSTKLTNSNCKIITAKCTAGETCCDAKPRTRGNNIKRRNRKGGKRLCKKTPKKCKRKGGVCINKNDECPELIDEDLCKGASCRCCKTNCKITKKCTKQGGYCVTDSNGCKGSLRKGCKGKGCQCCVPTAVKCGIESSASSRIINGVDVNVARKYSWQVGLKSSKEVSETYFCGGSIITNKHILTAAHCFYDRDTCTEDIPDEVYVGIGDHNQVETTDNLPDFVDPILVKKVIINPDFDCETTNKDVAVLELSKSIDLKKNADVLHPICLPKDDGETYAGDTALATGWGSTDAVDPGDTPTINIPNILQEVELPVIDNSDCFATFTEYMVCTGTTGGKDACFGDSGGPVSVQENGQFVQIGIVSFGFGCGSEGQFGGHARVNKFIDWIKGQVGSETTYTIP